MIHHGDCLDVMAGMDPESVDAIVTDPPYDLTSTGARNGSPRNPGTGPFSRGFMGKAWDGTGVAFQPETWAAALRVAKPSAYLLAFGGTRTVHRMTVAIEDAGWIIRDMLVWAYASGFPKSKASLKPAWEPIVMARKPGPLRELAIDACRIPMAADDIAAVESSMSGQRNFRRVSAVGAVQNGPTEPDGGYVVPAGRWPANVILTATEWYTLRHDVGQQVRDLIVSYFEAQGLGVDELPSVRNGVRDYAGMGEGRSAEVLLPAMQLEGVTGGEANGHPSPTRVDPADEGRDDGALSRGELAGLEGRAVPRPERLRVGVAPDSDGTGTGTSRGDDDGQVRPGAPTGDGDDAGSSAGAVRGSASPQRSEGRQPPVQPVPQGPVESHPGAPDGRSGTGATARAGGRPRSRERGVTVPLALIPDGWRQYFRFSHDTGIFDGGWEGVVGGGAASTGGAILGDKEYADIGYHGNLTNRTPFESYGDSGTYSRFFLVPKADRADREPVLKRWSDGRKQEDKDYPSLRGASERQNSHPTVKPTELMRHLVRLVTPAGGIVLDPFLGSGTTALAAEQEGFEWIGIEKEAEYVAIVEARLNGTQRGMAL